MKLNVTTVAWVFAAGVGVILAGRFIDKASRKVVK
jgi:hypothetical protein